MPNSKPLTEGPIKRTLFALALPIILGQLLQSAYQLIDAFWVGRLGSNEVAAVSVSFPITFLVISLGIGLGIAGATLTSQYMGAKQTDKVNHVAGQTLLLVFVTSAILGLCGYFFTSKLLSLMGVAPDVISDAKSFLHVSFISIVFVFTFNIFQALLRGIGEVKLPLYIVSATVILNAFLDPLLIFGWGPVPGFGVTGAAIATLITQGLAAIIGCYVLSKGKYGIHIQWRKLTPDWSFIKRAFFLGAPASLDMSTRALGLVIMSFLVASFGTDTMAAYGVGSSIIQMVTIPSMGLSMAMSTMVGQNLGARQTERATKVALVGTWWGFVFLTIIGIFAYGFAPALVSVFLKGNNHVTGLAIDFVKAMSLTWGFIAVQLCITSVFRASGNMMSAMLLSMINQWIMQFPIAYVLSKHSSLGVSGIWESFAITNVLIALVSLGWFSTGTWKKARLIDEDERQVMVTSEEVRNELLERRA